MAKKTAVKEEVYAGHKGPMPGMEVKTPYPEKVKTGEIVNLVHDIDDVGNKLADLSERVNEIELSVSDLTNKLKVVMGRMGL